MAGLRTKRAGAGTIGLIGHVITDQPDGESIRAAIATMAQAGVQVIEIQIPFSEPMADGPTFMKANHQALARGIGYVQALALMTEVAAAHPQVDFVFMTYLNIPFVRGYARFAAEAARAGARGLIVPDLPFDADGGLAEASAKEGLTLIRLVAPNTTDERLARIVADAEGFVYVVARTGVTGAASDVGDDLGQLTARIRRHTDLPLAVGFGIRGPAQVTSLKDRADYAIVGTAAYQTLLDKGVAGLGQLWRDLAAAAAAP